MQIRWKHINVKKQKDKTVLITEGNFKGQQAMIVTDHGSHAMLSIPGCYINLREEWFVRSA